MSTLSRDTVVAIFLLVFCGFLIWAGYQIRDPQFGELPPAAWPKAVSWVLTGFCLIYLAQSLQADRSRVAGETLPSSDVTEPGLIGWLRHYRNPIVCFALYFAFLITLPYLGTLIGGILLVFALLSFLGGITPKLLIQHALIAVISVGVMWLIFTYGLRVLLPRGELVPGI